MRDLVLIWNSEDYDITIRQESRSDRPFVVTDTRSCRQHWHETRELAIAQAINLMHKKEKSK